MSIVFVKHSDRRQHALEFDLLAGKTSGSNRPSNSQLRAAHGQGAFYEELGDDTTRAAGSMTTSSCLGGLLGIHGI